MGEPGAELQAQVRSVAHPEERDRPRAPAVGLARGRHRARECRGTHGCEREELSQARGHRGEHPPPAPPGQPSPLTHQYKSRLYTCQTRSLGVTCCGTCVYVLASWYAASV